MKDAGEIARIERACDIADVAFAQIKQRLAEGVTEAEFAAELEFEMRRRCAGGLRSRRSSRPGRTARCPTPSRRIASIAPGDLVVVDFGAIFDGYHSDMTRTVCVGEPSAADAALLAAVARLASAPGSSPSRPARPAGRSTRPAASRSRRPGYADGVHALDRPRRRPRHPRGAGARRGVRGRAAAKAPS